MHEHWLKTDLTELPEVEKKGLYFTDDSGANKIGVIVTDDGESITLSGTVKGYVICPDGSTKEVTGDKSGNTAWIVLPDSAYDLPGQIAVFIKLISGNDVTTLGGVEGYVYKTA